MTKYAKYSIWLAKAIVVFTAVLSFLKFFVTYDDVYAAMFASNVSVFMALDIYSHVTELKKRIGFIENRQSLIETRQLRIENSQDDFVSAKWFLEFEKDVYNRLNDCKKHVDNLTKTLSGDE